MKRKLYRLLFLLITAGLLLPVLIVGVAGEEPVRYENPETGYCVYLLDDLNLLTEAEERELVEEMIPVTEFGHAIFWSTEEPAAGGVLEQAAKKRYETAGKASAGIFVINLKNRKISFQSYGRIYSSVSESKARSITDNVSKYASREDYCGCAKEGFRQVIEVLRGNRISEPMKYLSYGCISIMLGLLAASLYVFGKKQNTLFKGASQSSENSGSYDVEDLRLVRGRVTKYAPSSADRSSGSDYSSGSGSGSGSSGSSGGSGYGGGGGSSSF